MGFGLENFVDAVSSALVVWRFWPAPEEVLESREKRASIGIAMAFVALGVVVGGVAISNLVKKHEPEDPDTLIALVSVKCSLQVCVIVSSAHSAIRTPWLIAFLGVYTYLHTRTHTSIYYVVSIIYVFSF